jgi:basic membrane lipoprotein Med (substrate-binding protein (PBP1-ABC) superfamily)
MSDVTETETRMMERGLNRAEWLGAAALALSFVQGAYIAGVEVQRLNDHDRRLASVESAQASSAGKIETLLITTSRIDANVSALAEQAKEQRDRRGQ